MVMNKESDAVMKKKTLGRRKIDMKKIESLSNRQVTFSKRRVGLFKKARELCVLTGAEITIIVQSVAGKRFYAFGHNNVDSVIDRFENGSPVGSEENSGKIPDHGKDYSGICKESETENRVIDGGRFWWAEEVDGLELEELERYNAALEELMKNLNKKAHSSFV
ncbi:agamous-like MADS-box AGL62 [Olea europaea subsp. europaea]|uniref:Agamous-like MADS-box AGL62 n=1 Tax=Olea europaea subsp. europaea TaxID=158383 RepID=A0A8S0UL77_OLEEU|nr:agamous-like MADS-box AGL62 [Olea europaea subsp. europaea]